MFANSSSSPLSKAKETEIPVAVSGVKVPVAMDVAKSGCHALAILSDVKGQASKIAFAGGVSIILTLLDLHPSYADLHRVAAVVILRMLQGSSHVGREITCNEGIRILLKSLEVLHLNFLDSLLLRL